MTTFSLVTTIAALVILVSTITRNRSANIKFYDGWINRLADFRFSKL